MLLKIILFPITVILNILLGMSKFILFFGSGLLAILAFILFIIGIFAVFALGIFYALPILFLGYLVSPWGMPRIGSWVIYQVEMFNMWLKSL